MYQDDEENTNPIYQHTKKENGLSQKDYQQYSAYYPCSEDTTVYRGLCFRTKSSFESFKKRLDNKEYFPSFPESFTRNYDTALDFAKQKKTFFGFLDENISIENNYRRVTEECISGYAGIILKYVIPQGKGLDINKSEYGVEDEILYLTDSPINVEYEIIESYENQLKKNPVDINKHLHENGLNDSLSKYLIANHVDEINAETQHILLDEIIKPFTVEENDKYRFLIDEEDSLVGGIQGYTDFNMDNKEI